MAWRSVMITRPSFLNLRHEAMRVKQEDGEVSIPLEDVSVILLENPQITFTSQLLSACAERQIAVITVGNNHHPNGVLVPHLPHSRSLKVINAQLSMSKPHRKRLWQQIVRQKVRNQGEVLRHYGHETVSRRLIKLSTDVKSGDSNHTEAQASQAYFPTLFGRGFSRMQDRFYNDALNYGYTVIRAALARNLVSHGFITAIGLHHHNEQNSFNLADDMIEPFRPLLDAYLLRRFPEEAHEELTPANKAVLVDFLHRDITMLDSDEVKTSTSVLAAIESAVVSLGQRISDGGTRLHMPLFMCSG